MADPPSVQAWIEREIGNYPQAAIRGDALCAEVLRLQQEKANQSETIAALRDIMEAGSAPEIIAELRAAKNSADFYRDLDNERSGKVRSLRAENLRLREALKELTESAARWLSIAESEFSVSSSDFAADWDVINRAWAALGSVSSEPPREEA